MLLARGLRCRLAGRRWTCMSCQELWKAKRCRRCHRFGATLWLTVHKKGTALSVSVDIFLRLWNFKVTRLSSKHVLISWIVLRTSSIGIGGVFDWISCFLSGLQLRKGQWLLLSSNRYCRARLWSSLSGWASVRAVNLCSSKSIVVTTKWCLNGVAFSLALVQSFEAVMRSPKIDPGPGFKWTMYSMSRFRHLMLSSCRRRRAAIALRSCVWPISSGFSLFWNFLPLWRFSVSWGSVSRIRFSWSLGSTWAHISTICWKFPASAMARKLSTVESENDELSQLQDCLISEMRQVESSEVLMKAR